MDAALQLQLTVAALIFSVLALFFSLLAAFPGLKLVLAAVRDGVLWFALFLVLGGSAFIVWQQIEAGKKVIPGRPQSTQSADHKLARAAAN